MKEYTKSGNIHPCRLERNDLLELIKIIKETFPVSDRKEDFKISTNLPDIHISSNSIKEFLKHEELPDKFDRLTLDVLGWSKNREINKSIHITFYGSYINLNVDGTQQTWVLGKYSQITNFLKKKKPWFWALHKIFPVIAGIIPIVFLIALVDFVKAKVIIYSVSTALFLIAWIFATVFYFRGTFLPYTQIILTPKKFLFNKENIAIIIAALSLIISIIGGIIMPLVK